MQALISYVAVVVALLVAIPVAVFCIEIIACIAFARATSSGRRSHSPRVAVLVPAHNESRGILPTLADIRAQLRPGDRLVVVADNCEDDTAAVALSGGAEVIERRDPERRGKGYALDFGLSYLTQQPPEVVIVIDADCRLTYGSVDHLTATCAATGRPVQALDLMVAPEQSGVGLRVAEFAWRVKNGLRPKGLAALGLPCQLAGTGMAFPWHVIRSANLASSEIVEDLKLGLDLTAAGHPPLFCSAARVTSEFPISTEGAASQRRRWEQGHMSMILHMAPSLLRKAVLHRNLNLLVLALDLIVPPLSLLAILVVAIFVLAAMLALLGFSSTALHVSAAALIAFVLAAAIAWFNAGRGLLPLRSLWSVVPYVLGKLGLYRRIFTGSREKKWIRTDRNSD